MKMMTDNPYQTFLQEIFNDISITEGGVCGSKIAVKRYFTTDVKNVKKIQSLYWVQIALL